MSEQSHEPNPEMLETQRLTELAKELMQSEAVRGSEAKDGSKYEEAALAVAANYEDAITQKTRETLAPARLYRQTSPDGQVGYGFYYDSDPNHKTVWDDQPGSEARTELSGVGAQIDGRYHKLGAEQLEVIASALSRSQVYDSEKRIIVRGQNKDRILRKNILGKVARAGMGARRSWHGDLRSGTEPRR